MLNTFDVIEFLAIDLLGVIPEDEAVIVATNQGRPLAFEQSRPISRAFHNIAHRLLGEDIPFLPIFEEPAETILTRLQRFFRLRHGGPP